MHVSKMSVRERPHMTYVLYRLEKTPVVQNRLRRRIFIHGVVMLDLDLLQKSSFAQTLVPSLQEAHNDVKTNLSNRFVMDEP